MIHNTETINRTLPIELICEKLTRLGIIGWHIDWSESGKNIKLMRYIKRTAMILCIPPENLFRAMDGITKINEIELWQVLYMASMRGLK